MSLTDTFYERARYALQLMLASPLPSAVTESVNTFFAKYGDLERTPLAEAFITGLILDQISADDSQSPAQPETKQVA